MKVTKVAPVIPAPKAKRAIKEPKQVKVIYQSDIDPAVIIHSNKTHRTASEAFRDAEYACSITKFKSDWRMSLDYITNAMCGVFFIGMVLLIPVLFIMWLTK